MATQVSAPDTRLIERFRAVRALSRELAAPLSNADATIQPHEDASPAKWHLAHTSWFFETFLLRDHVRSYCAFDERWSFLFNSYYETEGPRHARPRRGMLSRPSLDEVLAYRAGVEAAVERHFDALPPELVELGLQHEQQHQELMLMDMLAAMSANPLKPTLWERAAGPRPQAIAPMQFLGRDGGLAEIGHSGAGFAFDAETPRHKVHLQPYRIAGRPVLNAEWMQFIAEGGYAEPLLWLADGWAWVQANGIEAPLYWERQESMGEAWLRFGLDGLHPVEPGEPVCHISFYEAEAFARWAGARLPTEAEWEDAAAALGKPIAGEQLDAAGPVRPHWPAKDAEPFFGGVWEWTASAFLPYPGFRPAVGAIGEYNGKFMSGQMVLKGGCCATPRGHVRASYRNFYYPHQRWMFAGLRLARDC